MYLSVSTTNDRNGKLRKYAYSAGAAGCTLTRDPSFAEIDTDAGYAVTNSGTIYEADFNKVSRLFPGARLDCTANQVPDLSNYFPGSIAFTPDGSFGYATYATISDASDFKLFKITADATTCAYTPFTPSGVTLGAVRALAIDAKGRLQIIDDKSAGGNKRVVILDATGAFVSSYDSASATTKFKNLETITPCRGGMCVLEADLPTSNYTIIGVSDDGAFRSTAPYTTSAMSSEGIAGTAVGPTFLLGSEYPSPYTINANVLADR